MNAIASSIIGGTNADCGGVRNIIGSFFGVLSLSTIRELSYPGESLDQAWWTGITIAAMLCLFLVVQRVS